MSSVEQAQQSLFQKIKNLFESTNENGSQAFENFCNMIENAVGDAEIKLNNTSFIQDLCKHLTVSVWFDIMPKDQVNIYAHEMFGIFIRDCILKMVLNETKQPIQQQQEQQQPQQKQSSNKKKKEKSKENEEYWEKAMKLCVFETLIMKH